MRILRSTAFNAVVGLGLMVNAGGGFAATASNEGGQALLKALTDADEALAASLIKNKVDVNVVDESGATPLLWATTRGNADLVSRLLKAGANPNIPNANQVTPLQTAVANNAPEIAAQLLAGGANANTANATGETPLMTAARTGQLEVMKQLIARGADVNAHENNYNQTALMWSAGKPEQVKLLIKHGADIRARTKAWDLKIISFPPSFTTLGSTGHGMHSDGEYVSKTGGQDALFFAVREDDLESIKTLLDAGIDVNESAADGSTPLFLSLLKWDARDLFRRSVYSLPPKFSPNLEVANYLLDRGAKVNVADETGYTPLHGAVFAMVPQAPIGMGLDRVPPPKIPPFVVDQEKAWALVRRLVDLGANPNAVTRYPLAGTVGAVRVNPAPPGSSPLHIAVTASNAELTTFLLEHNGDPNLIRKDGHSPLSIATKQNDLPGVTAMVAHGGDVKKIYNPSDMLGDPVEAKARTRSNQTLVHIAGAAGADKVIPFLAERGAPLTRKNDMNETPLELADEQERFRQASSIEMAHLGLGGDANAVRKTNTTDVLKKALGTKAGKSDRQASNAN
jgi:ankyrin repeat protein